MLDAPCPYPNLERYLKGVGAADLGVLSLLKRRAFPRALAEAFRARLPHKIRDLARAGKLPHAIGDTGAAVLERCAYFAVRARADLDRACGVLGSSAPQESLYTEVLSGISVTMTHAFGAFEKRLSSPQWSAPTDLLMVVEAERELELLAGAVSAWTRSILASSEQPEYAGIREQLRLIRDMKQARPPEFAVVAEPEASRAAVQPE